MSDIRVRSSGETFHVESFTFPGGEEGVSIPGFHPNTGHPVHVIARLQSSADILRLALTTEIIDRVSRGRRTLAVPYFPYARQDRVTVSTASFSLKVMAGIVNDMNYDEVTICDPHSDVTPALIDRSIVVSQLDVISNHRPLCSFIADSSPLVVAPDAGAAKKAFSVAHRFNLSLIVASKHRDTSTGQITHTDVPTGNEIHGCSCLIVDDICDGGRTFVELSKVLLDRGAKGVSLYVTHGIFSNGFDVFRELIGDIYCTDSFSWLQSPDGNVRLHVSTIF